MDFLIKERQQMQEKEAELQQQIQDLERKILQQREKENSHRPHDMQGGKTSSEAATSEQGMLIIPSFILLGTRISNRHAAGFLRVQHSWNICGSKHSNTVSNLPRLSLRRR